MRSVIVFFVLVFLCSGVFAIYGVAPRSYEINFQPGLNKTFKFNFVLNDTATDLHVVGDLAKYVSLNKNKISGRETVLASLKLPPKATKAGVNQIYIIAGNVRAAIKVNVPYPQKFVELRLGTPDANVGDILRINLKMFNRGKDAVRVNSYLKIYKGTEEISTMKGYAGQIRASKSIDSNFHVNTSNYSIGNYEALAIANYGNDTASTKSSFMVGEPSIKILNYTKEIYKNKFNKFNINVISLSNNNIKKLYAEIRIIDAGNIVSDTPITKLNPWQTKTLTGFLNTDGLDAKSVSANITLHYDGKSSSKIVKLKVLKDFDYVLYAVILASVIIAGILTWIGFVFAKKMANRN